MTTYAYKGFTVIYEIHQSNDSTIYKADGTAIPEGEHPSSTVSTKFHTEYPSRNGVKKEIKKLIENYINFEWEKLLEMRQMQ